MDTKMIENWNSVVSKKDFVWILGDFAWRNHMHYFMALNGKKGLCSGNHDKMNQDCLKNFSEVTQIKQLKIDGKLIILCHYPMRSWNGRIHGTLHAFGHVHHRLDRDLIRNTIDVGVDGNSFFPYSWVQLIKNIKERNEKNPLDRCPCCGNMGKFVTTNDELRCGVCGGAI